MIGYLMKRFSLKESWKLWMYEIKLFHPSIYYFLKCVYLSCSILKNRLFIFINKYKKMKMKNDDNF